MNWFVAWVITSLLLLGAMVLNTRMGLRSRRMLNSLIKVQKILDASVEKDRMILDAIVKVGTRHQGLGQQLCEEMLKEIEEIDVDQPRQA